MLLVISDEVIPTLHYSVSTERLNLRSYIVHIMRFEERTSDIDHILPYGFQGDEAGPPTPAVRYTALPFCAM